jgi:hypothetical protein
LQYGLSMKKALHKEEKAFLYEIDGKVYPEEICIEEIIAAVNRGIKGEWGDTTREAVILRKLHEWICRYIEEGATEDFISDLNSDLHYMQYFNYVVPPDFYSSQGEEPHCLYVANLNITYTHESFAAKEFSRLITYGKLNRIKRCQLLGCENIFVGPPQAKWCSKTCGSKHRVRDKRRRDSS